MRQTSGHAIIVPIQLIARGEDTVVGVQAPAATPARSGDPSHGPR